MTNKLINGNYVCIKDTHTIKAGETFYIDQSISINPPKTVMVKKLILSGYYDDCFINPAQWRDKQINDILDL